MTERIRWEPAGYGGWTGHVGTRPETDWLFQIWSAAAVGGDWQLDSTLPGHFGQHSRADDPATLKTDAEFLLAEFVSSLGAILTDALREAVERERGYRNDRANDYAGEGKFDRAERCWGWTDALDFVLALIDRATPETTPVAGKEKQ